MASFPPSLQIIRSLRLFNHIKQRLCTEPPGPGTSKRLERFRRLRLSDLHRRTSSSPRSRIRHQLRVAALLQADEPEHGFFDRFADGEEAVVLEQGGFFGGEAGGDGLAFGFGKDDAVEGGVEDVVLKGEEGVLVRVSWIKGRAGGGKGR